tara:strand:- start:280 stop:1587 length:1308 start_codon:yes stop_codon:yes gene_type:complete
MNKIEKIDVVPKSLVIPFILITSMFALWGFANAVTDPMVQAFKKVLELSNSQAAWVQMAFYGGYFCMALPAAFFVRKYSYKVGVLIGLFLYALGAILFYPAAITEEFWFFCLGLYILTFGLAFLETTANPYILSMGKKETATQRLNLAQAFNPIGSIGGLIIAQQFILKNLQSDNIVDFGFLDNTQKMMIKTSDLLVIRDPYVVLGLVVIIFFIIVALYKMPEGKDDSEIETIPVTFKILFNNKNYIFGVISQLFYVGAQIMCWTYIYQYAEALEISSQKASNYQFIAFILFFLGRIWGTYLLRSYNPGRLLMIFSFFSSITILITIFTQNVIGLYSLVLTSFFMSIMFPTIYGIALEELNEEVSKIGAAGLVMAIVGGALMPKFQGNIIDLGGHEVNNILILGVSEVNFSFILPLICFIIILLFGKHTSNSIMK